MLENCKISGFADEINEKLEIQLEVLPELGQKYIELRSADGINVADLTLDQAQEIKARMEAAGVRVSALGSPIGKIMITDEFEPHFEKFCHVVELAKLFETPYIRMFSFYLPQESDPAAYEGEVFDRIGKFVDYASANDTLLLHENEKDIYGAMAPECKKLMDTFYGDHFKAIFDFANFVQCGQDTLEAYEMLKSYIAYIHVKDALKSDQSVVPAGYGDGNVAVILKRLSASGFDGFLSLEPHLFEFEGFHALEKDGRSIAVKEKKVLSGLETFTIAHDALMKLLDNCM